MYQFKGIRVLVLAKVKRKKCRYHNKNRATQRPFFPLNYTNKIKIHTRKQAIAPLHDDKLLLILLMN